MACSVEAQISYGKNWANIANPPFHQHKYYVHEDGIGAPLVAYWPQGIAASNRWNNAPTLLIDLMAMLLS